MLSVSKEQLIKTLKDFYNVTKIKIVMYDSERHVILSYPEEFNSYCSMLRTVDALAEKCRDCDNYGFDLCDKTKKPCLYRCHARITEAIAPIYANDISIGYLMFGQVICDEDLDAALKCAVEISNKYPLKAEILKNKLETFTIAKREYLLSALNLMSMCASYLYTADIIKNNSDILAHKINDYITNHISENLSTEPLCKLFYISKSKLYKISISSFGMGIAEYIRQKRLVIAEKKLISSTDPVSKIAMDVGICDTNYFIRIFKEKNGITPGKFRLVNSDLYQ